MRRPGFVQHGERADWAGSTTGHSRRETCDAPEPLGWATVLTVALGSAGLRAQDRAPEPKAAEAAPAKAGDSPGRGPTAEKKFADFNEVTKGATKIDGLFTLHRKDEHLYAEIRPNQLDQPLLAPINIARGWRWPGSH